MVDLDALTEEDWTIVRQLIARHIMFTNSAFAKRIQATLADQPFVKVMPGNSSGFNWQKRKRERKIGSPNFQSSWVGLTGALEAEHFFEKKLLFS